MSLTLAAEHPSQSMARHMGKLIDQFHRGYYNFAPGESWTPNANLYETESSYIVCVDLAGVEKDKIDISIEHGVLRLHGHRPVPVQNPENAGSRHTRVHLMEIDHGSFSREVELPANVRQDKITAQYRDGMLWIELPKQ